MSKTGQAQNKREERKRKCLRIMELNDKDVC